MLEILRKLAGKPASSGDLRAALAEIEAAGDRAAAAHGEARAAFEAAVIAGDERAVVKAEAARTDAARAMDRSEVAAADLRRRLADAEALEADAALDADVDAVRREADSVRKILVGDYVKATRTIVDTLRRLAAAEDQVAAINARLAAAGRTAELLPEIEATTFPPRPGLLHVRAGDVTRLKLYLDARDQPIAGRPAGWPE